jgi:membrane protein
MAGDLDGCLMLRFLKYLKVAFLRSLEHDQFSVAKAAAYSAILTVFPAALLLAAILAASHTTRSFVREISFASGRIIPATSGTYLLTFLQGRKPASIGIIISTALLALWTGSGVMISWMEGFRRAYQMPPHVWNTVSERMVSFLLVFLAGVPMVFASLLLVFGSQIEHWLTFHSSPFFIVMWTLIRWIIAVATTVAVIALIYHHGLPRTQPWHRVVPGSVLATGLWIASTSIFGWYLRHYNDYGIIYGSVGAAIALMVWLYIVSYIVLVGAEYNAMRYPRYLFGSFSKLDTGGAGDPAQRKASENAGV